MVDPTPSAEKGLNPDLLLEQLLTPIKTFTAGVNAAGNFYTGLNRYMNQLLGPFFIASRYFTDIEKCRILQEPPLKNIEDYLALSGFSLDLINRSLLADLRAVNAYAEKELPNAVAALFNTVFDLEGEAIDSYMERQARAAETVARVYPEAIADIESEFGFHFERGRDVRFAETDRFVLYQVMPTDPNVKVREDGKPIFIMPPFVLGANILSFLPGENRSYTHNFANQGIPTYIRVMKNIQESEALQKMTGEDDALDTKFFCEKIMKRHGRKVTLNGYCQGGFSAVCDILSGELDGLVDALITCVSPMDGTRSKDLVNFLESLPTRFNALEYGVKQLPNGNQVADGNLMGWVYKLKSIEVESPLVAFFRDLMMLRPKNGKPVKISSTAAALNYWLMNERSDLPLGITEMSYASYTTPVTPDGTLPVKLFNRKLNFKGINEKGIQWLICYGEQDDLVEPQTALAPLDYIDAEVAAFPKGHVAIATSWSNPTSACALHTRFGPNNHRGPVRFQLDLESEGEAAEAPEKPAKAAKKTVAAEKKASAAAAKPKAARSRRKTVPPASGPKESA
jgi:hypothetical protein